MSGGTNVPISTLLKKEKEGLVDGNEHKKKTREEWRKEKELEELRKLASVPPAQDELGNDINPHIPQYISTTPWYYNMTGTTLTHQRPQEEKQHFFHSLRDHYVRGQQGTKAKKWRKGACDNCGGMGHIKKECMERPRKVGARFNNTNIRHDDVELPNLSLDFDGKRDRWNGFDANEYKSVVDEHEKIEEFKRKLKADKLKEGDAESSDDEEADEENEDEDKYADHIDMPGTKVDSKQRITVRNLRIREDTAKYLRNLDIDSAHYDPKTRSMRNNPYENTGKKKEDVVYAGENFIRYSGDTMKQAKAQSFAWEAYDQGVDISVMAEPTKLEMLHKQFSEKKTEYEEKISESLLDKYGGKEHLKVPPRELLLAQSEEYIEYSRSGKVIVGAEKAITKSRYEEDVYINNHTSVWGSYYSEGQWGFHCCHSIIKNSYCTGSAGKTSIRDPEKFLVPAQPDKFLVPAVPLKVNEEESVLNGQKEKKEKRQKNKKKKRSKKSKKARKEVDSSDSSTEDEKEDETEDELSKEELRKKKLREALIRAKIEEDEGRKMQVTDERERGYNVKHNNKVLTEEDIEAHQIRRCRDEDPMSKF